MKRRCLARFAGLITAAAALSGAPVISRAQAQNYAKRVDQARDTAAIEQAMQQPYLSGVTPAPTPRRTTVKYTRPIPPGGSIGYATNPRLPSASALPYARTAYSARAASISGAVTGASGSPLFPGASLATSSGNGARTISGTASLSGLRQALTMYYLDTGRYPTVAEGLTALLVAPAGSKNWRGPYISVMSGQPPLSDPWGTPYRLVDITPYKGAPTMLLIKSNGPDTLPDTPDDMSVSL